MADTGIQTITGEGEFLLDDVHLITWILFFTFTPTIEVDYRSIQTPRRQLHAGWISTASGQTGVPASELTVAEIATTWSSYFEFESNLKSYPSSFPYDDRIQWRIPDGITAKFIAVW